MLRYGYAFEKCMHTTFSIARTNFKQQHSCPIMIRPSDDNSTDSAYTNHLAALNSKLLLKNVASPPLGRKLDFLGSAESARMKEIIASTDDNATQAM
jgi:hypothetical protein